MKSINVTFENVEKAESAIRTLSNDYKFTYSLKQSESQDIDITNEIYPSFYDSGNNGLLYSTFNFIHNNYQNLINQSESYSNDIILKIKCQNKLTDILIGRLYNLGGRNIKTV